MTVDIRTATIYDLMVTVKERLNSKRDEINILIKKYESNRRLNNIWIGDWKPTDGYPCITLEPITEEFGYMASDYTIGKDFAITVNFYVKNPGTDVTIKYIAEIGEYIHNVLNEPKYTTWTVEKDFNGELITIGRVWQSYATTKVYSYLEESIRKVAITYVMSYQKLKNAAYL